MKINTQKEATSALLGIQNLIREKNENKLFGFMFKLNSNGEFVLSVINDFRIEFKNKRQVNKIFSGTDFVSIVNDFLNFFIEDGGEGNIIAYGNNFKASFHYESDWVVDNIHNGCYVNHDFGYE